MSTMYVISKLTSVMYTRDLIIVMSVMSVESKMALTTVKLKCL